MSLGHRTARLPFDHLHAELVAFPLASEAALRQPLEFLDPQLERRSRTAGLWRAAERDLLTVSPGVPLNEFVAMRDRLWFHDAGTRQGTGPRPLQEVLRTVVDWYLESLGAGFGPKPQLPSDGPSSSDPSYALARRAWMWLTFALPEDLLLAVGRKRFGAIPHFDPLSPGVRALLFRGFAETHLHVGASLDFGCVWSLLMARLAKHGSKDDLDDDSMHSPGAVLREGRDLVPWLRRAAIARVMLARFLHEPRKGQDLMDYMSTHGTPTIDRALTDLRLGELTNGLTPDLQDTYGQLAGFRDLDSVRDVSTAMELDPVAAVLGTGTSAGSGEQRLVALMCAYLEARPNGRRPDLEAARLFWQTVRIRTLLYRHIIQRPLTPGLEWFIRFYRRLTKIRGDVSANLCVDAAITSCGASPTLDSLEVRTSPGSQEDLRNWVNAVLARGRRYAGQAREAGRVGDAPEVGLVLHFVKIRGGVDERPQGGRGSHADPSPTVNIGGYRYSQYYQEQRERAFALASLLHDFPRSLYVVRGLDLCSDELAVPAWVFKPLLGFVRRSAVGAARWLARWPAENEALTAPLRRPPPLRTTVHVGEDFAHLLTGLRNVHDAIRVLDLREGDRIGHGMALGVDPFDWTRRVGKVAIPLEERAFDLAWEWTWWTKRGSGVEDARMAYLAREIPVLGEKWFGRNTRLRPLDLEHLAEDLTDLQRLRKAGFPNGPTPCPPPREGRQGWLYRYLTDVSVFRGGRRVCWVDPENEATAIDRIGTSLREEISHLGLAVEINPTSNLLIGDLSDLNAHPLWRISPPVRDPVTTKLAITIGSDDPIIFNSSLPQEYQRLYDALLLAGLSDADVLAWLDGVRQTGLDRKFTTSVPAHSDDLWVWQDPNPQRLELDGLLW